MTDRMPRMWRRWLGGLLAVTLAASSAQAQPDPSPSTGPLRRLWTKASDNHLPTPVPPALEIEILDPNVDPRGNPAIVTKPGVACTRSGPEGRFLVDIPETVLVHRYFYTGDRSFQGPFIPGGPTILVLNHPKTGERCYIPVQMLPGAPRVTYTHCAIEYDYGTQRIKITFGLLGKPVVKYEHGVPLSTRFRNAADHVKDTSRRLLDRTDLPAAHDRFVSGTKTAVLTTIDGANRLGKIVLTPVVQVGQMLPFVKPLTSTTPERLAERERNATVRRATSEGERTQGIAIGSNR